MKFTWKGTLLAAVVLLVVFAFGSAYEDVGLAEIVVSGLGLAAAAVVRRFAARGNTLSDIEFSPGADGTAEAPGSKLNQLLSELEEFEAEYFGRYGIHFSRANSIIDYYQIPSIDGETFLLCSVIAFDKDTGSDTHIIVELQTGRIVKHSPVLFKGQYRWPFDYCPLVESLRENQMLRRSNSIRETLKAMGQGQLQGDYTDLVVDKDIQNQDAIVNVDNGEQ